MTGEGQTFLLPHVGASFDNRNAVAECAALYVGHVIPLWCLGQFISEVEVCGWAQIKFAVYDRFFHDM